MASPENYKRTFGDGSKLDPGLLKAEISAADTARVRRIESDIHIGGITPQALASLLLEAETGDPAAYLDLAEQMEERDLHYLGVLGTRKRQVSQLPITLDAATDEKADVRAADFVREWLNRDALESELFDVLDAIGKGYSGTEIIWNQDGALWFPEKLKWRVPRWFAWDPVTGEIPLLRGGYDGANADRGAEWRGVPLPPAKFLFHLHPAKSGLPIRNGLARAVAWAYLFKNFALKDWLSFADIYGRPFRIGKYPTGSNEDQIRTLLRAVAGMGEDAAAVIPEGMSIELVDGKANGSEIYDKLAQYVDRQISKAVLGQTATTDADTGGLGSGKEHGDVRADIERADAKLLSASIARDVIAHMVRLNFGPDVGIPRLKIGREEEWDAGKMMPAVKTFVELGGRVEMSVIADKLGLPDAPKGKDAELLWAPAAAAPATDPADPEKRPASARRGPKGPETPANAATHFLGGSYRHYSRDPGSAALTDVIAAAVARRLAVEADEIDQAADSLVEQEGARLMDGLSAPVANAIAAGASFEEVGDLLDQLTAELDDEAFEQLLEHACIVSRAAGVSGQ
jgi:phage gp29-like protein